MRAKRRLKSACAFVQSDQSLRCPHEEICLSKMRPDWSDSANAQAYLNLRWAHMSEGTLSVVVAHFFSFVWLYKKGPERLYEPSER